MIKRFLDWRARPVANAQRGMILITVVIAVSALMIVGMALISSTTSQLVLSRDDSFTANALQTAEAGIEQSIQQLNSDDGFSGYATPQQFFDNSTQGYGVFTVSVTSSPTDGNAKIITSIGKVYRSSSSSTPVSTKIVRVTAVGTQSQGYSVQSGPGGLIMGGSAHITNSDVYVGGRLQMTGAAQIGTDAKPSNVYVANYACPTGSNPGATYPSLCSGTAPISIPDWSTVAIIGTTCATGQTQSKFPDSPYNNNQPQIRAGSGGGSGLVAGCTAPNTTQPSYDRAGLVSGVTTTASGTSGSYACSGTNTITLPANIELTGSTINWGSSCTYIISGNVYIPGNLTVGGAAQIKVAAGAGTTRPIVAVDGTINVGGSASMIANGSGTGIDFVSFKNSTGNPAVTPAGTDLYNSQTQKNVQIGGAVDLPGMIFDAYWSEIVVTGSGNVGAAAGQTVNMSGAGTVTFGTKLSSGARTWTISSYQELYPNQL
jgi:Tfp pilus assembly protein PilX